jgi:hypothetical protein
MVVEMGVVATVVVGGVVILRRRRLATGALPSVVKLDSSSLSTGGAPR